MQLEPGVTLGRFRIDEVIDRGSVVDVYKAYDAERQQHVAIEIPVQTGFFRRRKFGRDVEPLLHIKHPNVVNVYETAIVKGLPILVAEFIDGSNLTEHLSSHEETTPEILEMLAQIADGLRAAHAAGVIHGRLDPSNILVTSAHKPVITDLGLAELAGKPKERTPYMAPEVVLGLRTGDKADIYALGALSYELLCGTQLEPVPMREAPAPVPSSVPEQVRDILVRMLQADPLARPNAVDVARTLRHSTVVPVLQRMTERAPRYIVQFDDAETMKAALAAEGKALKPDVQSARSSFFAVAIRSPADLVALEELQRHYGARIEDDERWDLEFDDYDDNLWRDESEAQASLDDVVRRIAADEVWPTTRGERVTIAIVDSGIDGSRPEFATTRRAGSWEAAYDDAWRTRCGHGTMCATIALASRDHGGDFDGVAPAARIISCKVTDRDSGDREVVTSYLTPAFEYLAGLAESGMPIVAVLCWGRKGGKPPKKASPRFLSALSQAIDAGVMVVCSAGNYHELTTGDPGGCSPCSIWLHKGRADLLTVGTCRLDGTMWPYSSRGPGQFFGEPNTNAKPDVTAPTPAFGRILYGERARTGVKGWGTSGAAPQVAGLAALLLSAAPGITRAQLHAAILESADRLTCDRNCCGAGMINCRAALQELLRKL